MEKLILSVALTGAATTRKNGPYLPYTPVEIAEEAKRAVDAGATICHIHAREDDGTPTLVEPLYFGNGGTLAPDESFLFFLETHAATLKKYWLKGPKAGQLETTIASLAGYPDNITTAPSGIFWIAMVTYRNKTLEDLFPSPFLRKLIWRLPEAVRNSNPSKPYGFVIGVNAAGNVLYNLQDTTGQTNWVTSAIEHQGALWMGSNLNDVLVKYTIN